MLAFIGISFLIILVIGHELGHFAVAKFFKLRVDEFGFGFPPKLFSKKIGETKYSFNLLPFGGFVRIYGEDKKEAKDKERSFFYQPAWKRALIVIAGAAMNFLIGWIAIAIVLSIGVSGGVVIEKVAEGSPAEIAGFSSGEILEGYSSADEFLVFIDEHSGEEIIINEKLITPRVNPPEGEGALGVVILETGIEKQNPIVAIGTGFLASVNIAGEITKAFASLISGIVTGNFEIAKSVTGPVGVYGILGETSKLGGVALIQFLGVISLNLAVLNLIPFPALDGGRLLFVGIEKLTRRPINQKIELAVNGFGIALLLLFMVIVTIRDVGNIL